MSRPELVSRREPDYSAEARAAGVQGTVLFDVVIDDTGKPTDIRLVSPRGYGLDERALEAISQWRFKPAKKDGKPVRVRAYIEVNFRLSGLTFDAKDEQRRTSYNRAMRAIAENSGHDVAKAKAIIADLARQKYPAAMYLQSVLLRESNLPENQEPARALLFESAKKKYGPSLFELGSMYSEGRELQRDPAKGLAMIDEAAMLGSAAAQFYLGARHETDQDPDKARRYFRLCAAEAQAKCQFRLARLLLSETLVTDRHRVEAVAWLRLAADKGLEEARTRLAEELPKLTPRQLQEMEKLHPQLTRRP